MNTDILKKSSGFAKGNLEPAAAAALREPTAESPSLLKRLAVLEKMGGFPHPLSAADQDAYEKR
jgi:hypothetical protein